MISVRPLAAAILSVLAAVAIRAAPASAEESGETDEPTPSQIAQAEEEFELGLVAYKEDKYAQALVHFLDSYDLNPLEELHYNIAYCYEQIGQDKKAVEYYRRYLESVPEDEEKERAKVMAKIEELEGTGEEEGPKEGKAARLKTKVTGKYKGDWMHGLAATGAFDMDVQGPAYPHGDGRSGLGVRGGYGLRLVDRKLLLGGELGFLSIGTLDLRYYNFIIDLSLSGRVGNWAGGTLQLYVGGVFDIKWYFTKRSITHGIDDSVKKFFSMGFGPLVRLYWHWGEKIGLLTEVGGAVGLVPTWDNIPLHGYVMFRLGIFFGLV